MPCEHDVYKLPRTALNRWLLLSVSLCLALSESVLGLDALAAQAVGVTIDLAKPVAQNDQPNDYVANPASVGRQTLVVGLGSLHADTHARSDTSGDDGPFLIPLLPFGLSNQVLALKEALALAAVLNWTVVALGFWPHSSEMAAAAGLAAEPGGIRDAGQLRVTAAAAAARIDPGPDRQGLGRKLSGTEKSQERRLLQRQHQQRRSSQLDVGGEGREGPGPSAASVIPFDLVFDRRALAPLVRVISREEAVQLYGWSQSGHADALLSISSTSGLTSTLQKAAAAGLLDVHDVRTVRNHGFRCDDGGLSWLRRAAEGHRWVGLYSYRRVVPAARSSYRSFALDSSLCARMYHQVSLRLRKSQQIRETAERFMDAALLSLQQPRAGLSDAGGGDNSGGAVLAGDRSGVPAAMAPSQPYYIALHVRPYPDTCFEYFAGMTDFDATVASKVCRNPRLLINMVPIVRQLLAARARAAPRAATASRSGLINGDTAAAATPRAALFVMSHPRIRAVLRRELSRLWNGSFRGGRAADDRGSADGGPGLEPTRARARAPPPLPALIFLDAADLPPALRGHVAVNSLLSVVEQEVCRRAAGFIGTKASSISVLVAQERVAADAEAQARAEVQAERGAGAEAGTVEDEGAIGAGGGEEEARRAAGDGEDGGQSGWLPGGRVDGYVWGDQATVLF